MTEAAPDIKLCGHEPPKVGLDLQPCILEPGHDGDHRFWMQAPWDDGSSMFGVVVYDGTRAIANLEVAGELTAEEVAAIVAVMELAAKKRKDRGDGS